MVSTVQPLVGFCSLPEFVLFPHTQALVDTKRSLDTVSALETQLAQQGRPSEDVRALDEQIDNHMVSGDTVISNLHKEETVRMPNIWSRPATSIVTEPLDVCPRFRRSLVRWLTWTRRCTSCSRRRRRCWRTRATRRAATRAPSSSISASDSTRPTSKSGSTT